MAVLLAVCPALGSSSKLGQTPVDQGGLALSSALEAACRTARLNWEIDSQRAGARRGEHLARRQFSLAIEPRVSLGSVQVGERTERLDVAGIGFSRAFATTGTRLSFEPSYSWFDQGSATSTSAELRQPLLRGISPTYNRAPLDDAELATREAARAVETTLEQYLLQVTRLYLDLALAGENRRILQESVADLSHHVALAEARVRAQVADHGDVLRARVRAATTADALSEAARTEDDLRERLRVVLELDPGAAIEAAPLELVARPEVPAGVLSGELVESAQADRALSARRELASAKDAVDAADRRVRIARHGLLPDLDLSVSYNKIALAGAAPGIDQDAVWRFSLVGSGRDVRRDAEIAALEEAVETAQRARLDLLDRERSIREEVRAALRSFERQAEAAKLNASRLEDAAVRKRIAESRFRNGLASNLDLLDAEDEVRSARLSVSRARAAELLAEHQLALATGRYLSFLEQRFGLTDLSRLLAEGSSGGVPVS